MYEIFYLLYYNAVFLRGAESSDEGAKVRFSGYNKC